MLAVMMIGTLTAQAETFTEDFENVTITDADSWGYGTTLSNGWMIVDGQVSGSDATAYTLGGKVGDNYLGKDNSKGLAALYGSSNNAFIVTNEVSGNVTMNVANYGTAAASIYVYEAVADGESYTTTGSALYSKTWTKNTNRRTPVWEEAEFDLGSTTKRLAIVMVKATMDNFAAGDDNVTEKYAQLQFKTVNPSTTVKLENGSTTWITFENIGTADATGVKLNLFVDGELNNTAIPGYGSAAGIVAAHATGSKGITYDVTKIQVGAHQVNFSLTADNCEEVTTTPVTVTFTADAPQPTYSVTAENVTVPYGVENYEVIAMVTNTSDVDATDVDVKLYNGGTVLVTKTIPVLAAKATEEVRLMVTKDNFEAGKTYDLQVMVAGKASTWVKVTTEAEPVAEVKDLSVTEIVGTLDLANASNNVRVTVQNTGTVDITDAPVTLKAGENVLGSSTVSATAGQYGWCTIAVSSEGLEAGTLDVTATVTYDEGKTAELTATLTVTAAPEATATLEMTAADVEAKTTDENISFDVNIKNTGEAEAKDVVVKVLFNNNELDSKTITLAAGAEQKVTFTVANPFTTAGQRELQVITADNKFGCYVKVTVTEPVVEVVDINLVDIRNLSEINLTQTNVAQVWFENNSTVEAAATIALTMNGTAVGEPQAIANGAQYVSFTLPTDGLNDGDEVTLVATLNAENNKEGNTVTVSKTVSVVSGEVAPAPAFTLTAQNVEVLTTDNKVKVVVNVKNTGNAKAAQVEVKLLEGMTQIGESKWIWGLEADADQNVTFEFNNFTQAGTHQMQAWAVCGTVEAATNFDVIVKAPVAELAIESITGTIDLANTTSNVTVTVKNNGTADVRNAAVTLTAGENVIGTGTISYVKAGETGYGFVQVASEGLTAGDLDVTAKVEYDQDKSCELTATLTVKAASAAEPTFTVAAENVTVPFGAQSFDIAATITNTSEVDAQGLTVKLLKGIEEVETKTLNTILEAGKSTTVTFTVTAPEGGFEAGKTVAYFVQAGNGQANVDVTFEAAPVEQTVDMAITTIHGLSQIDLTKENKVQVWYENKGTMDLENVTIMFSVNDNAQQQTVSVAAGKSNYVEFTIDNADFEPAEDTEAELIAWVNVEGDIDNTNNRVTRTVPVINGETPVATFSVVAENVTVPFGAQSFDIVATITNTSEIDAQGLTVKLLKGAEVVDTKDVNIILEAGKSTTVTFTVNAPEGGFEAGKTAMYYVQAVNAQDDVEVIFENEAETPVIDMAIEAIQGATEIKLNAENKVTVWYKNNGNMKMENVAIMFSVNDHAQEQPVTVEAGKNGYVEFTIPTNIFEPAEDTEAELVAWVNVDNDADATNNRVTKTLPIVSGEVAPAAEIAINPISGWEVQAGEQTVNVTVTLFNNGEVEAKDVTIELYKSYGDGLVEPQTVDVPAGETNWKVLTFTFNYTFEAGKSYEFTAFTNYQDANSDNQMQKFTLTCPALVADVAIAKIAPIEATTEDEVKIAATLTNRSDFAANGVKVGLYKVEDLQYQLVGIMQTVEEIAAGEAANVEFNLGTLAAGNYTYYVRVISVDGNATTTQQDVTVKVTEPVQQIIDMGIQAIQGPSEINLRGENVYKVWYINEGNVTVENANIILLVDGENEAGRKAVTVEPGKNGMVEIALDLADFDPVEDLNREVIIMGYVNVDGDVNTANNKSQMTATVVSKEEVAEPVFTIVAQPVEVELGTEKFDVVATITSDIDAENVEVKLFYNQTIATQTVSLTAGQAATVTFADVENPFTTAGEHTMYVLAGKASTEVAVTVKPEAVAETIDMAITAIQGLSQIDLTKENKATVWYENKGTKDLENVVIMFSVNDNAQQQTVSVAAGKSNYVEFTIDNADFEPAEDTKAELIAWVNVEGDVDNTNDRVTRTVPVINGETPVATFSVVAENVTVPFGSQSFDIVATITNTSEVDAQGLTVKLLKGIEEVETKTLNTILEAGKSTTVTFTVNAPEGGFEAGKTAMYYVQAVNAQDEVEVTFEQEPVAETADLAIYAITGTISLENDANYLTVWVNNNGTVDVDNARVVLTVNGEEAELGEGTVSVKAGQEFVQCKIQLIMDGLEAGILPVRAEVIVENDATPDDNVYVQNFTVAAAQPVLSFTVEEVTAVVGSQTYNVKVNVKNTGKGAAENVAVKVYNENSALLAETTIASIAAGGEETATLTLQNNFNTEGSYRNALQVWVAGVANVKWVTVTVTNTATGIAAIKAQYGEDVKVYTLNGQKVNDVKKGQVYIINGKKVAIK